MRILEQLRINVEATEKSLLLTSFSREKQRLVKSDPLKNSSSPANSDGEVDGIGRIAVATKQVTEAEAKLKRNK